MVSNTVVIGDFVEFIYCGCGCKRTRPKFIKSNVIGKFIKGHHGRGKRSGNYKGGNIDSYGYKRIFLSKSQPHVLEHRYIYEKFYGIKLTRDFDIHHKDGNKLNNNIDNLEKIPHKKHVKKFHIKNIDYSKRFCQLCKINNSGIWYHFQDGFICHKCYMKNIINPKKKIKSVQSLEVII